MDAPIVIKTVLVLADNGKKIQDDVAKALNSPEAQTAAKNAGRKIGDALGLGIEAGRNRPSAEQKELAHIRRLETINTQHSARIEEIERRKQSQLDAIRERSFQRELEHQRKIERETQRAANSANSLRSAVAGVQNVFAAVAATGIVSFFGDFARRAIDAAIAINQQVNSLQALTGSAEAAKRRFGELVAIARQTPGLTTNLAATLDTQLRILNVSEQTINRVLPAVGRLNAISPISDPRQLVNNLTQLVTQNFERQDLKELVGQSPFAGNLIKEIFNVDNPTNAKAIRESAKKLGINTVERFFDEIAKAAENNPRLRAVQESLAGQFEKMQERINGALAPIGDELLKTILPTTQKLVGLIEESGPRIVEILRGQEEHIANTAKAMFTLVEFTGGLIGALETLDSKTGILRKLDQAINPITQFINAINGIQSGGQKALQEVEDFFNPDDALFAGGGSGSPLIVGPAPKANPQLFPPESSGPVIVNRRGQILDRINGKVIGRVPRTANPGDLTDKEISKARALREAQLAFAKSEAENEFELLKDANDRTLKEEQRRFDVGLISAKQFFEDKRGLLEANIGNEINLLNNQLLATQGSFNKTKANTAERAKLAQQIDDLQTKITLKTRALGDVEKDVFQESITARKEIFDLSKQQLEVIEEQNDREKETLRLIRERAETQQAIIRAAGTAEKERGKDLDKQILLTGENLDTKVINAQKEAMLELKQADEDAILSMIKNRERLADASIFHADRANAIFLDHLANQQSVTQATGEAMIKAYEGVASSLDRGIDRLTNKLGVFGDVINGIIKSITRNILARVFAPTFGASGSGGGGGGFIGSILGGVFGNGAAGGIGNIFRTPPTFGNFAQAFAGAGGGGISAPPSISAAATGIFANGAFAAGLRAESRGATGIFANGQFAAGLAGANKFSFGALGKSLGAAAPFLGLTVGAGLGGQSIPGQILGGIGGALGGLVAGAATGGITGSLGSLFSLSGALGPAALVAAPLLIAGGILLGKAKQRHQDEEASGEMIRQALAAIDQLASGISSDQIDGSQARSIFDTQILGTFRQQISGLKTRSVVESRLKNTTRDLEKVFEARIPPLIAEQEKRRNDQARFAAIDSRLVPEFATGGTVPGIDRGRDSVLAMVRPGEKILTLGQQADVIRQSNPGVFDRAGVPRAGIPVGPAQAFAFGGTAQIPPVSFAPGSSAAPQPIEINLQAQVMIGKDDATRIVVIGADSPQGRQVTVNNVKTAKLNREL